MVLAEKNHPIPSLPKNDHCSPLCLLHMPKLPRFLGGPNWPKICVWGTKCNFKDWEKFAPWDLEERRTDLEGQRHRTSRSHSAASRLVLYLGAGNIIEKIIDSWHMSIFSSYLKIISIKKNIFGNCHKLSISNIAKGTMDPGVDCFDH